MENIKEEIYRVCLLDSKSLSSFERLLKKLNPDFTRESVRKKRNKSRGDLSESIHQYFKNYIILNAVIKSEDLLSLSQKEQEKNSHKKSVLMSPLSFAPLYLKTVPLHLSTSTLECIGLNQQFVTKTLLSKKKSQSELREFTKLVEDNISEFCAKLTEYSGQKSMCFGNKEEAFKETIKDLSAKAVILDSGDSVIVKKQHILQEMLLTYYEELTEGLSILRSLLNAYERKLKFELNLAEHFAQRSQCLHLKIKVFELDIMIATYTKQTLPALRQINDNLDTKEKKLSEALESHTVMLEAYQVLGPKYEAIVEQYSELCENVNKQKWAILSLQRKKEMGQMPEHEAVMS